MSKRFGNQFPVDSFKPQTRQHWSERNWPGHDETDQLRVERYVRTADGKCAPRADDEAGSSSWRRAQCCNGPQKAEARPEKDSDKSRGGRAQRHRSMRKTLRETERQGESDGGWCDSQCCCLMQVEHRQCSMSSFACSRVSRFLTSDSTGVDRERETVSEMKQHKD